MRRREGQAYGRGGNATSVAIVGGGLAGLAAAAALAGRGLRIELLEARRRLGGRAGSFHMEARDEWIDHCQHVGMACCTNLADFCRRTGIADQFRRHATLHFFGPDGRRYDFQAARRLPAPLHLAPALWRLKYLSPKDRLAIARALLRLARESPEDLPQRPTVGEWLRRQGQSRAAVERFWEVVLVSALGESLDRASLPAARKVFVDGFMASREGYCIDVPTAPLHELYDGRVAGWLEDHGVTICLGAPVRRIHGQPDRATAVGLADGAQQAFDYIILAATWRAAGILLDPPLAAAIPQLARWEEIGSSPITGVHLWFDRPIGNEPHAVFVGRLSQWVFRRALAKEGSQDAEHRHYYQVVISASRDLQNRKREDVLDEVLSDLRNVWPAAEHAQLLEWKMVTEREAVFSVRPGFDQLRPAQQTPIPNLMLAGDWTATGWPATMEGAVRSGYLAAEAVLATLGRPEKIVVPNLPRGWLARIMLGAT